MSNSPKPSQRAAFVVARNTRGALGVWAADQLDPLARTQYETQSDYFSLMWEKIQLRPAQRQGYYNVALRNSASHDRDKMFVRDRYASFTPVEELQVPVNPWEAVDDWIDKKALESDF